MTGARHGFVVYALDQLGKPALWGAKGPDAFDCSGLVTSGIRAVGGPDLRNCDNAQCLFNDTMPLSSPEMALPGDLLFFGPSQEHVAHVAIVLAGGRSIDAAGATSTTTDIHDAVKAGASVRTHANYYYRSNLLGAHRNHWLDAVDLVCK